MIQQVYRPSSVPKRAVTINLGRQLPTVSSSQPGRLGRAPLSLPYLALLRAGFGRHAVRTTPGGLLPHHFTLVLPKKNGMFLFHFPSGYPAWELPSALPGGARTFLPSPERGAVTQPAGPRQLYQLDLGLW
jgi:hypothetical protein